MCLQLAGVRFQRYVLMEGNADLIQGSSECFTNPARDPELLPMMLGDNTVGLAALGREREKARERERGREREKERARGTERERERQSH